jgi:hypothetical protein
MVLDIVVLVAVGFFALIMLVAGGAFCTPVRLSVDFHGSREPLLQIKAVCLGGLWSTFLTNGVRSKSNNKKHDEQKTNKPARKSIAPYIPYMLKAAPRLVSRAFAHIKIETVSAHIKFGLPDPADTGVLYGVLTPFTLLAEGPVSLQPNFGDAMLEGRCLIVARFTPITLVLPALNFAWSVFIFPRLSKVFR